MAESRRPVWLVLALACALFGLQAASAGAAQQIEDFDVNLSTSGAGGHPNIETSFALANPGTPEAAKNVTVNMPEGVFGNPNAVTKCGSAEFALDECPTSSQAGLVTIRANYLGVPDYLLGTAPIYNTQPPGSGETVRLAFSAPVINIPISVRVAVRTADDYGLRFTVSEITQVTPLAGVRFTVWGVPAHFSHHLQRFPKGSPGNAPSCPEMEGTECLLTATRPGIPVAPYTVSPTVCTGEPLVASIAVQTYQEPDAITTDTVEIPPTTECAKQVFNPVIDSGLTTNEADAPSGLSLRLRAPQFLGEAVSPSELRSSVVTLPDGLTINPDAADGQTACPEEAANFDSEGPHECPDSSKVGTFVVRSPALNGPLAGSLYIGEPQPGNQYRVFMMASGFGINAKLVATIHPDPLTGRLTFVVENLPQVPFDDFEINLFASDRGLMATPTHCSIYAVEGSFVPWNDAISAQSSVQFLSLGSGPNGRPCPPAVRPFNPRLVAGTSNPEAGAFSDFHLKLDRDDGDQFLGDLNFRMPPGFTGDLKGISYCSEASITAATNRPGRDEQASPSCPASSLIGTTNVAAGPGSKPFNAVGRMYLAGPLKGAPLSLVAITPALAGPYDYGVVVVRVALHIDPLTAQVSAASDRMPSIVGGIPIRMRTIQVNIDRPNFTINPTRCTVMSVDSQGIGDQGTVTDFSSYFHAVNCGKLPFAPKMTVRQLGPRKDTRRSRNPRMRFELRTRAGDANIKSLAVTLPKAFAIDQRHLGNICSKSQLESESCAGRQAIGTVMTRTPLLDAPLAGPAYAVSGFGKLPRLAFILDGQVRLIPQAESASVKNGHLRTVVPTVPDAPIGYFRLDLFGGKRGYLVNTRDLCVSPAKIDVAYTAQSGRVASQTVKAKTACGASKSAKRR
jgi:hypothetical protein